MDEYDPFTPPAEPMSPSGGEPAGAPPARHRRFAAGLAALALAGTGAGVAIGYSAFSGSVSADTASTSANVSTAAAVVDPGLVDVDTVLGDETAEAAGTGMVLTSTGLVLTNNHVIEGATSITVTDVGNKKTYTATVVGYDVSADVAVIKLAHASGLDTVTTADSDDASVGESVVALGNAGGTGGTPYAASGTVTALDQSITAADELSDRTEQLSDLIETDADVQAGDSGGPLVDAAGEVIAMDTAASTSGTYRFDSAGTGSDTTQGYAIPIDTALRIAREIEAGDGSASVHTGTTAFLGVEVRSAVDGGPESSSASTGVEVLGVEQDSPGASAGIAAGDVITAVDGSAVTSATALSSDIEAASVGSTLKITWQSTTGATETASVAVVSGPAG